MVYGNLSTTRETFANFLLTVKLFLSYLAGMDDTQILNAINSAIQTASAELEKRFEAKIAAAGEAAAANAATMKKEILEAVAEQLPKSQAKKLLEFVDED